MKAKSMRIPRVKRSKDIEHYIDPSKKVRVYRNLHKGCFSVKQGGLVRCHAERVTLGECEFIVSKAGQKRVREEKKKNVHAFVDGYILETREADRIVDGDKSDEEILEGKTSWESICYNPYKYDGFVDPKTGRIAGVAEFASIDNDGILAYSVSYE